MEEFTMFQLCRESDGYFIHYDYVNMKLYGNYNPKSNEKANYKILLILPFINFGVKIFNSWLVNKGLLIRRLICILIIFLMTLIIKILYEKLIKSEKTVNSRNRLLRELQEPDCDTWKHYLKLARKQIKKKFVYVYCFLFHTFGINQDLETISKI